MDNYGEILKGIRVGKSYSQKYVVADTCTQGNYSKFESGENREIKFSNLKDFLSRLEMSFEEFNYISNNYIFNEREEIVHLFYNQNYNSEYSLYNLKKKM